MGAEKVFSMFPWLSDWWERTSSICLVGAGGAAGDDGAEADVEIGGGGISKVELLWLKAETGARKRDSAVSTISISLKSPRISSIWAGEVLFLLIWRETASSSYAISSSSRNIVVGPTRVPSVEGFSWVSALEVRLLFGFFYLVRGLKEDKPSLEAIPASWALFRSMAARICWWASNGSWETSTAGQKEDPFEKPKYILHHVED